MKYVLTHYSGDWTWAKEYTDDLLIFNRSEEEIPGSVPRENTGDADYDRLCYLVDNYDNLPETFLLAKSNLFKYITKEEFERVKDNHDYTPLLTNTHKVYDDEYGPVAYYAQGMYWERNDSWYLNQTPSKYFESYSEFARAFLLPSPQYLSFAPGGNYILTRERVHRYSRDFYEELASLLPYCQRPGEAQIIERTYHQLWK